MRQANVGLEQTKTKRAGGGGTDVGVKKSDLYLQIRTIAPAR